MNDIIDIVDFLWFKFKKRMSSISEEELKYQMRKSIHFFEKTQLTDRRYLFKLLRAQYLYQKARKEELLSEDEIEWCERVIYGKSISNKNDYSSKIMEEIDQVIRNRRSVRQSWTDDPLTENDFRRLIDIARWSPSACNRQPWNFILTNNKKKIKLLANQRGNWIEDAPSCILVIIDMTAYHEGERSYTPYLDTGSVIQTLLLKAEAMDYGACWVNFGVSEVDKESREEINKLFSLPYEHKIVSIIPIGKYEKKPDPPGRKNAESMMFIEEYDG